MPELSHGTPDHHCGYGCLCHCRIADLTGDRAAAGHAGLHRWDPHLHAPGTLLNDQFGGDWDAYLDRIEKSEPRIEALGVTDYFCCIDTYKEARESAR